MTLKRPTDAPALYSQDGKGYEAIVFTHYFVGGADWFVTEYDPEEDIVFGWACLGDRQMAELGYTSLTELEAVRIPVRVNGVTIGETGVEHDDHWQRVTLREAVAALDGL